ncbi:MAG: 50S ribosomal protein L11 [Candidatus Nanohaloarchaea archaeon]|nr:50S ribosomal protein L11 [Candidatus Nanohaloarchaea archaeon]
MSQKTISSLVEAGNASAGPPLGPQLGPTPVNIGKVVSEINEKTKDFEGMEIPVDVIVDEDTGEFEVEVGTPPVAALIKDKAGIESGSGEPNKNKVADLDFEDIKAVANMKRKDLVARDLRGAVKEVLGSCMSAGITVDGKDADKVQKLIDEGEYDEELGADS